MSSSCTHVQHRNEPHQYLQLRGVKNSKTSVSLEEGYNDTHQRWEICDKGLFPNPKKAKTRRHPHSVPRDSKYKTKKSNAEDMS